jgi:hypothetical protein
MRSIDLPLYRSSGVFLQFDLLRYLTPRCRCNRDCLEGFNGTLLAYGVWLLLADVVSLIVSDCFVMLRTNGGGKDTYHVWKPFRSFRTWSDS